MMSAQELTMDDYSDLVREDPGCVPHEKETAFHFNKEGKDVSIYSGIGSVMRGLIEHKNIEVERVNVLNDDGGVTPVELSEVNPEEHSIVGVHAMAPIGILKIQKNERKHDTFSSVIARY